MKRIALLLVFVAALGLASFASMDDFSSKTIQIGMTVSNLDQSLFFYKDILGMVQVDRARFDVDADFAKKAGLTDNLPVHVEVLKLGSGEDATQLKLMSFGDRAQKQENEFIHSQTGVQYLTFTVTNLASIVERLKKNNIPLLGETPVPVGDNDFVLVKDPDGTFVELIGPLEIIPPTQYQVMKEKTNFDKYKKEVPYTTPSRTKKETSEKKFDFFGLFKSKKDKAAKDESAAETVQSASNEQKAIKPASVDDKEPDSGKQVRDKFDRFDKTVPYRTPARKDTNRIIP
jgi:catechol 2,3-dioxygenase-like lactoylglutathione lyase family enzyme